MMAFLFSVAGKRATEQRLISQSTGIAIGDMIDNGGLAAGFDGNNNQTAAAGASRSGIQSNAYIGKTYSAPKLASGFKVWGSNDQGFVNLTSPSVTAQLFGKTGAAPSGSTDGTLLNSAANTDANSLNLTNMVVNSTATYEHIWVRLSHDGVGAAMFCAEVELYENS